MIYLDHAAATPVSEKAKAAMLPYFSELFFNPSSPYLPAHHLRKNYEYAKEQLAHTIGAKGIDLIITSGATEANNLAFTAVCDDDAEILILATEHASIQEAARGNYKVAQIGVDRHGRIKLDDLRRKMTEKAELVSVSLVNNELGTIQPLAEIAEIIREERKKRLEAKNRRPLFLHSDASQALNLIEISVSRLGVDLLTINSAKIGGPKGVGALYAAHGVKLKPLIRGGGQEAGLRSGTENVPGVIGFAEAAMEAKAHTKSNRQKYEELRQILREELEKAKVQPLFLGEKKHQLSNFCPVSFPGIDAERLIYKLEERDVYLSTGAACAASKGEKSKTLMAIGLSEEEIAGSLRISLGVLNNRDNVKKAGQLICEAVKEELERMRDE